MASMADYVVLNDGPFDLDNGETHELEPFFAPSDLVKGTNRAKAILMYKAKPLQNPPFAPECQLRVDLRFQLTIETVTISNDSACGLWEAFSAVHLNELIANRFRFESISGRVRISDVILWFQRRV